MSLIKPPSGVPGQPGHILTHDWIEQELARLEARAPSCVSQLLSTDVTLTATSQMTMLVSGITGPAVLHIVATMRLNYTALGTSGAATAFVQIDDSNAIQHSLPRPGVTGPQTWTIPVVRQIAAGTHTVGLALHCASGLSVIAQANPILTRLDVAVHPL